MANENKMGYLPIKKLILQMSLPPTPSALRRYGSKLYVTGDVNIPAESAGVLGKVVHPGRAVRR